MPNHTTVTATILDPNGAPYANGSYTIDFIAAAGQGIPQLDGVGSFPLVIVGNLDGDGALSVSVPSNDHIYNGSTWKFSIMSEDGQHAFTYTTAVTGATLDLTTVLCAAASALSTTTDRYGAMGVDIYVFGGIGSDSNSGLSRGEPKATIQAAITACVSWRGDRIWVGPGSYPENVVVNKHSITIEGAMPSGTTRPDVEPAAGKALVVSAQGFISRHMRYVSADDDCVVQEGNGFLYEDNVFDGNLVAAKAGLRLRGNAVSASMSASEGKVLGNRVRGNVIGLAFDSANVAAAGVGPTDNEIASNHFYNNTKDITAEKTGAGGVYSVQTTSIGPGNNFTDKNKACYIDITTNCDGAAGNQTGAIVDNFFAADALGAGQILMVGTGFAFVGNRDTVGVVDGSGLD